MVITLLERAILFPFAFAPGAKLGLANIITLLAIFTLPYKDSLKVVWMRLLISTLLGGTLSTFLYSFAGAFLSYGGMLLVRLLGPKRVSMIGISATGGILHNLWSGWRSEHCGRRQLCDTSAYNRSKRRFG